LAADSGRGRYRGAAADRQQRSAAHQKVRDDQAQHDDHPAERGGSDIAEMRQDDIGNEARRHEGEGEAIASPDPQPVLDNVAVARRDPRENGRR
jgi:hypothetical protein